MDVNIVILDKFNCISENLPLGNYSVREVFQLIKARLSEMQEYPSDQSERAAAAVCIAFQLRDHIRWKTFGVLYRSHGLGDLEAEYFSGLLYARTTKDRLTASPAFLNHHGLEIRGNSICLLYRGQI